MSEAAVNNNDALKDHVIRFGIGSKLSLAFSIVALMSVAVAIVAWLGFEQFDKAQTELTGDQVPAISAALKLSEEIARLTSVTPLLKENISAEERASLLALLEDAQNNAIESLALIESRNLSPETLASLREGLEKLPGFVTSLNEKALQRSALVARRITLETELATFRDTIEKNVQPLLLRLRADLLTSGTKGQMKNTDALGMFGYQEEILEVKSATNLLVGLLAEGGNLDSLAAIEAVETKFRSSIIKLAVPISKIEQKQVDVSQLQSVFQSLLEKGSKGGDQDNIFLVRRAELGLSADMDAIIQETRIVSSALSENANMVVGIVEQSIDDSVESNRQTATSTRIFLVTMAIAALVISMLIGWLYVSRGIIGRLMVLVQSMEAIAHGDLTTRVNRNGSDEISMMGKALTVLRNEGRQAEIDRTAFEEQSQIQEQESKQNRLAMADNLEESSGEDIVKLRQSVSVLTEKAGMMDELSRKASEKSMSVSDAAARMAGDMGEVSSSVGELSSSVDEISKQAQEGWATADDAVNKASVLNDSIDQLQDSSLRIGEVIMLINDVAAQTNMLALNATIEAERAGDAGKGFAVVASEVKGLASQTEAATSEIDRLIKDIQDEITSAVNAAGHISTVINRIKEVTTTIASAVEEQSAATSTIDGAVLKSVKECEQVSEWIKDVYGFSQQTGDAIGEVKDISHDVERESQSLETKIATFLQSVRAQG